MKFTRLVFLARGQGARCVVAVFVAAARVLGGQLVAPEGAN